MKAISIVASFALAAGLALSLPSFAQAPSGSTGECKDGSYTTQQSKRGACRGHGGVKDWYATSDKSGTSTKAEKSEKNAKASSAAGSAAGTTAAAKTTMPAENTASASRKTPKGMRTEAAPGGGPGKVWVNSSTHVYHCSGDEWYGKTKSGEYMSESEAKSQGAHAARGKACA